VMFNSFWGYFVFYFCLNVCICWALGHYKYHHLIVKTHVEFIKSEVALKNSNSLYDVELILGLFFVFYFCLNVCICWTLGCYEYHHLIVKMYVEFTKIEVALKNLNSLCDVWTHFGVILYFTFVWMCAYVDKIYTMSRYVDLQHCKRYKLVQQKLFKL
jgi:hypothetical protein